MKTYESMTDFLDSLKGLPITFEIQTAFIRHWSKIHGYDTFRLYNRIVVSVSGGSDSDILIDMVERIGYPEGTVIYVFYDTGLEFKATKDHLDFLEKKYDITIIRMRVPVPVPIGCKKYGLPFLSKQVSEWINRLQRHGFKWEDRPFEELYQEYPRCKAALRWWCNDWGNESRLNISYHKWLKEFMIDNPPDFMISARCCEGAKKRAAHKAETEFKPDLSITGVRKYEGGARAIAYKSCFDEVQFGCSALRLIFWFKNADKEAYEQSFCVTHSDCYAKYGLRRTGCACCPFGRDFEAELAVAEKYEPNLHRAALHVFGKSYEYTRKYREYRQIHEKENTNENH